MPRPYDLPPMTALVCFEAAARNLSFKQAAMELNVTPAAVSHQIKALEAELGVALFRRQHRGVDLTESGAYLFLALQRGFEGMSEAVRETRGPAEAEDVVVQATTAVSAFWLTPQIATYWRDHPEIVVSQMVTDAAAAPGGRVDLSIHYGPASAMDESCQVLFHDEILAVGTPDFAAARGLRGLEDLARVPLIHVSSEGNDWTGWAAWFAEFGMAPPAARGLTVNNHMIALQLARDGAGAVLGWTGLIGPLLEARALVPLVAERLASPQVFYLRTHGRASARARAFRDWLVAQQAR